MSAVDFVRDFTKAWHNPNVRYAEEVNPSEMCLTNMPGSFKINLDDGRTVVCKDMVNESTGIEVVFYHSEILNPGSCEGNNVRGIGD